MANIVDPLTLSEAAELTGLTIRQIRYAVSVGHLPAKKLPGLTSPYLVDRSEVLAFAELRTSA